MARWTVVEDAHLHAFTHTHMHMRTHTHARSRPHAHTHTRSCGGTQRCTRRSRRCCGRSLAATRGSACAPRRSGRRVCVCVPCVPCVHVCVCRVCVCVPCVCDAVCAVCCVCVRARSLMHAFAQICFGSRAHGDSCAAGPALGLARLLHASLRHRRRCQLLMCGRTAAQTQPPHTLAPPRTRIARHRSQVAQEFDARYSDPEWVRKAKHWPPRALDALHRFLTLT